MLEPIVRRARSAVIDPTHAACIGVLIVLPLLLLSINQSFIYSFAGWLDPWIYAGYHVHFASMWHFSPWVYYGTRVPYTALGSILYRIAGTEPSLYLLVLTQFYVAMFSLYFAIRLLFDSPIAGLAAACLLGTNSWFLWAIGWQYIDGPSIACMLFSFASLVAAAYKRQWRLATILWGAGMAATAALYLLYVVLLPIEIVTFVVLDRLAHRRASLQVALLLCAGFAVGTALMGLVNWGLGGKVDFWTPTFTLMFEYGSSKERALYYVPWHTWIWSASWLLFPGFAALASTVLLAMRGLPVLREMKRGNGPTGSTEDASLVALALACVLAVGGFAFMQGLHFNTLQIWYHENILWPFAFLVFGGCFATGLSRMRGLAVPLVGALAPILCLAPWMAGAAGWIHAPPAYGPQVGAPPNSLLLPSTLILSGKIVEPLWVLAGATLLVATAIGRNWLFPVGTIAFLSLMSTATMQSSSNVTMRLTPAVRDSTLSIYDLASIIDANRDGRPIFMWWNDKDPALSTFQSLGIMYILNPFVPPVVPREARVVFLASSGDLERTEDELLMSRHLRVVAATTKYVRRGKLDIGIAIAELQSGNQ